jgi:GAF domain-containing protein
MWKLLSDFFKTPVFPENEEKTRVAKLLHQLIIAMWSLPTLAIIVILLNPTTSQFLIPAGSALTVTLTILMLLNHAGRSNLASILMVGMLVTLFTYLNYNTGGEPRPLVLLTVIAIMMSGLLLGSRAPLITAILLMIQHAIIVSLNANGVITPQGTPPTPTQNIIVTSVSYLLIGFLLRLAIVRIQVVLDQIREGEKNLQFSNRELQALSTSLEQRVAERTNELGSANAKNERRAAQFEAIAQVSRTISSTQDLNTLLPQITSVISRLFGFYHVGIFLLDPKNEYAVLSAANSEGGQKMLARGHRLRVGETGIVGYVTSTGNARVALDTGSDVVFFNNPDLPHTRSEMALPFKVGTLVIGALDVQSKEANAFAEEDVSILSILSEQVGIAIQNSRQYEETHRALAESETLSRQFVRQGWQEFTRARNLTGIRHTGARATLLYSKNGDAEENLAAKGQTLTQPKGALLVLPVKLRDEVIGTVNVRSPGNREWEQDELDIVTAIIERAAVALENARLLTESQKRAAKERTIGEISAKISAQSDIDELLKTAAVELGRTLPKANISIQFKKNEETG